MKHFCLDTSGISNPLNAMPFDLYEGIWVQVFALVEAGKFAVTPEVFDELIRLKDEVGDCFRANKSQLILEVGDSSWDWPAYVYHGARLQTTYESHISERIGGKRGTVGLTDVSIIALAKSLDLPLISMEIMVLDMTQTFRRTIPNLCQSEGIEHIDFNTFLRRAGIRAGR